jgi:transcriptional regulator with XRE-family HTH domain
MDTAKAIVNQLYAGGLSDAEIARRVSCSQPTIWRLRNGKSEDCRGRLYQSLLALREQIDVERGGNKEQEAA